MNADCGDKLEDDEKIALVDEKYLNGVLIINSRTIMEFNITNLIPITRDKVHIA
jgi:hypothetical protein